jgi:hypothetical protein
MVNQDLPASLRKPGWAQYLACYVVFVPVAVLAVWTMLQLRVNLLDLMGILRPHPFITIAIDKFGVFVLAVLGLAALVVIEHLLRTGLERDQFWPRALRIAIFLATVLAMSYGLQYAALAILTAGAG